jgi:hypothetical protein
MSAWIYPTAYPTDKATIIVNSFYLSLGSDGSIDTYWAGRSPAGYFSSGAGTVPLNQWSLATATWDGTSAKVYVNGQLMSTNSSTGTGTVPGDIVFGAENLSRQFVGSIDDIRLYNRALSGTEVGNLYNSYSSQINVLSNPNASPNPNLFQGMVGYWPFNGNAKDATAYRNNGTVTGATLTTDRKGRANSAYAFNGAGSTYVSIADNAILDITGDVTVSAWIKPAAATQNTNARIVTKYDGTNIDYLMAYNGTTQIMRFLVDANSRVTALSTTSINDPAKWYHLVGVRSGSTVYLYVNGSQEGSAAVTGATHTNNFPLVVGADSGGGNSFNGSIDDVRVWNRGLSQAEVTALYNEYR